MVCGAVLNLNYGNLVLSSDMQKLGNEAKRAFVISSTEGCATNLQENNSYRKEYIQKGMLNAESADSADLILINTCAYSQQMEDRSIDMINEYKNKYPMAEVMVAGCLPKINPKKMKSEFEQIQIKSLPETLDFADQFDKSDFEFLSKKHRLVLRLRPFYYKIENFFGVVFNPLHNIFKSVVVNEEFHLVTASTGCLGKCTFCAIKRAKGSLKSRPLPTMLADIENGLKNRSNNRRPSRSPYDHKQVPIFFQNRRGHGAKHPFSGNNRISFTTQKAIHIRRSRLD